MIRARPGSEICEKLKKNAVSPKTAQFSHDSGLNCRPIRGIKGKLVRFPHCSFVFRGKSYFFCGFTYPLFSTPLPSWPTDLPAPADRQSARLSAGQSTAPPARFSAGHQPAEPSVYWLAHHFPQACRSLSTHCSSGRPEQEVWHGALLRKEPAGIGGYGKAEELAGI